MADSEVNIANLEKSIEALESRNAFQDDIIEQLNQELAIHQEQIAELKMQLQLIAKRVKDSSNSSAVGNLEDETPPPHY